MVENHGVECSAGTRGRARGAPFLPRGGRFCRPARSASTAREASRSNRRDPPASLRKPPPACRGHALESIPVIAIDNHPSLRARDNPSPSLRARAKRGRSNPESGRATHDASRPSRAARPAWIASAASPPRNDGGYGRAPASRARLAGRPPLRHCEPERSEGEAIQNWAGPHGTPPAHHVLHRRPGLLRRLRRLAMTVARAVPPPPAHDSRAGRPSVIASASEASAKQSRIGRGNP